MTFCLSTTLSHFDLEPHIDNLSDPDPSSHMNYLNPFTAFISTFHHTQAPFLPNNNPLWWQGFTPTAFMLSIANHRVEFPKQLPLSWMASTLQNSCGYMAAFHNKLANKKYLLRLIYFRRQIKKKMRTFLMQVCTRCSFHFMKRTLTHASKHSFTPTLRPR